MRRAPNIAAVWTKLGPNLLPFADAASAELPLPRLLRLSLFQVSVGMAVVLLSGTLNRVLIVEMGVSSALVALMVALPLLFAPARALIGHRSDTHRSVLGWKRVPYIWFGTLTQFGGLAIMPFALIILSGDTHGPLWVGHVSAALAFLLVGAGLHTTQTAGLALANDLAPPETRPRVVALLYVMLLLGMTLASVVFGLILRDFSQIRLIQVIQGAALLTMILNVVALWRQEARDPAATAPSVARPGFKATWSAFMGSGARTTRLLVAVGLGTAAFAMQDILLEPYGGEILRLGVAGTTTLTALSATGALLGFAFAARALGRGGNPCRIAAFGALVGLVAFTAVIFAAPFDSAVMFRLGSFLIGLGSGLFAVGTLTAAMALADGGVGSGLALGAWGAVQATAAGLAVALGGALHETIGALAMAGHLGATLAHPATGYGAVYYVELVMLFATLVAIGPLAGPAAAFERPATFGLADMPA